MKRSTFFLLPLALCVSLSSLTFPPHLQAAEPASLQPSTPLNPICPVSGKPANPSITAVYEGTTYAFAAEACRTQFLQAREKSLYHQLGGKAAIDAAVNLFYQKVLADSRIKHFFDDINMEKQRRRQKEFLSAALGGPVPYTGKDLRKAHANLPGLNDTHFDAVAENLQKTLQELKIAQPLIDQVMAIAASTRNEVLNRPTSPR